MSTAFATMSIRAHALTPEDELTGSLTRERVALLVRYAGALSIETSGREAKHWLSYALNTEVPISRFDQVCWAFAERERVEEGDLEFWFGVPNTQAHREALKRTSEETIAETISLCAQYLSADLELTA